VGLRQYPTIEIEQGEFAIAIELRCLDIYVEHDSADKWDYAAIILRAL
jgi:hypothetical protein